MAAGTVAILTVEFAAGSFAWGVPVMRLSPTNGGPFALAAAALVLSAALAPAQSGHNLERPAHWKARYDDGTAETERRFVVMRPGWHVFAGPGGLFWDPGSYASGAFAVSSTIFLFPEGDPEQSGSTRLDSPFGLFLGGSGMDADGARYVAFELRNDGRFRIAEHTGGASRDLVPWTAHDAVVTSGAGATGPVENVLAVDVRGDRTVFHLNDRQLAELPGDRTALEGLIGVRAGAGLSLHVTEVDIGPNRREE
jgi:hypothetical protein